MKKTLAVILTFLMLLSTVTVFAEGETENITVYLSVSKYGEIAEDKNGEPMAYAPVALEGQQTYTLDDVFKKAHKLYYPDGAEGYASSVGDWGLGVDMLWGDTSYNFGYQVNCGKEAVMGPGHEVKHGDYVDACIYQNLYPDTEGYSFFDIQKTEIVQEDTLTLTLSYASGYDENWNTVFSPCEGATILVNGEETEVVTDENGVAELVFDEAGTYIVSAKKAKILNEKEVPAITAPVCILTVNENLKKTIIHHIAEYYTEINPKDAAGNLPWIVADMAVYIEVFPESTIGFTEDQKEEIKEMITEMAMDAERPGDMAKSIIALRAMGYDARKIFTQDAEYVDVVEKLLNLVEEEAESVHNIYTLPYVIIALTQSDEYAEEEQLESLVASAITQKEKWQDVSEGTDAMTPMILALAPFADEMEEVKTVLEESIEILKGEQREDGLIDGFEGYESASTGLAICALSAVEEDAERVVNGEKSLIDGLLSTVNEEQNGFSNPFATEQGFRGLLSHKLMTEQKGKRMYDFSDYPMKELNVSNMEYCPVFFDVSPQQAQVIVDGYEEIEENLFDLPEGEHSYQVKRSGYKTEEGTVKIKAKDAENHIRKEVTVTLSRKSGSSSSGGGSYSGGGISNKPAQEKEEIKQEETVPSEKETEEVFSDVAKEDWFYSSVCFVYEKNIFGGTEKGFEPDIPMTRSMLATVLYRIEAPEETQGKQIFLDVAENAWYYAGVIWCAEKGIVNGVTETEFAPDVNITREQLAVMLYRYAQYKQIDTKADVDMNVYKDAEDVADYAKEAMEYVVGAKIIGGRDNGMLSPKETATRAEVATVLMRFMEVMK